MKHYCKNHPDKIALSLCHSCGEYFCSDCLNEGLEYYYCNKDECVNVLNKELSKKRIIKSNTIPQSKETKIIKRVATIFIILSSIVFIYRTVNIVSLLALSFDSPTNFPNDLNINIVVFYLLKYFWLVIIIAWLLIGFTLFASIKLYQLKNRILFLYALISDIFLIILYNIYFYSYLDYFRKANILELGYERYKNFWSIERFSTAIISLLIIIILIYIIKKFSTEKIKKEFSQSNA